MPTFSRTKKGQASGYHHGDLRQALIDTALRILAKKGSAQLNLRHLARQIGVSHAAPYRHFQDKRALLEAVAEEGFRKLTARMRELAGSETDPWARLQRVGIGYILFATENPAHYRVMFGPEVQHPHASESLAAASAEAFSVLQDAVGDCLKAGAGKAKDPASTALFCWSTVHGLSLLIMDGRLAPGSSAKIDVRALAEEITSRVTDSLKQPRPGKS